MRTFDDFIEEWKPFHNDICIFYDLFLARLIGVRETGEDWYYIYKMLDGKVERGTAVGWCVSLKATYPIKRYEHMEHIFHMNQSKREDAFKIEKYESN